MIRTLFKFMAVVFVFCAVAGLSAYFTLSWIIKSEDTVIVPDLSGKNAIEALEQLTHLGLNTKVTGSEYSDTIAKNYVIRQDPGPGEQIKKNRYVCLVISKGSQTVRVPDLRGQKIADAQILLEDNGLAAGDLTYAYFPAVSKDRVVAQDPEPGNPVARSGPVDLLVSAGDRPEAFMMPDMKGLFMDEAILSIEARKMKLDGVESVYDKTRPPNTVIGQAPPAGYRVEQGDGVRLMINRKPGSGQKQGEPRKVLFTYRLPPGFLKQQIRLEMSCYGTQLVIYDGLMEPGATIWALVPEHTPAAVFLYRNDRLVKSEVYD